MVKYYGMSEAVGTLSYYDSTGARGYELTPPYSNKTAELIDEEVKKLIDFIHEKTRALLLEHKEGFLRLAQLLMDREVILAEDVEKIFGPKVTDKPAESEEPAQDASASEEPAQEEAAASGETNQEGPAAQEPGESASKDPGATASEESGESNSKEKDA